MSWSLLSFLNISRASSVTTGPPPARHGRLEFVADCSNLLLTGCSGRTSATATPRRKRRQKDICALRVFQTPADSVRARSQNRPIVYDSSLFHEIAGNLPANTTVMIGLMIPGSQAKKRAIDPHNRLQGKRCNMFVFVPA